jgi:hypothetical protein
MNIIKVHYCGGILYIYGRCAVLFIERIAGTVVGLRGIVLQVVL